MATTTGERWHTRYNHHEGLVVHDENGLIVAHVSGRERHADARMIAAAPALHDALAVLLEESDVDGYLEGGEDDRAELERRRGVIRAAYDALAEAGVEVPA